MMRLESVWNPPVTITVISQKDSGKKYKDCTLAVSPSGKLKKSGTVTIDGFKYTVKNYKVVKCGED